jgi:Antitoxin ParD
MMIRMQISLTPEDHRRARARAAALGISVAEYVRRLLARDLGERSGRSDPQALFDLGDSGGSDVARNKHRYIGEAVESAR